ncbi:PREDICTED: inositol 1,4,5-trisphosphate receptor-interacting protein-like 1 [Charadrius vociferus]|uniref:inositol 1,4,5-trisphosphate receptor-interacting protein-like 1 n=1 Tax=Charadrius vociferus TaxID=50402 RepID=UPI000521C138|nr:PREDICTED: inositol 1,4,5-trisphosphate receptor-interacting protein-like 1 [Charadrius vociferus]
MDLLGLLGCVQRRATRKIRGLEHLSYESSYGSLPLLWPHTITSPTSPSLCENNGPSGAPPLIGSPNNGDASNRPSGAPSPIGSPNNGDAALLPVTSPGRVTMSGPSSGSRGHGCGSAARAIVALGIVHNALRTGEEPHTAMHRLVQHLAQQLSWKMTQLLQDLEQIQDQNWVAGKVLLLAAFQQWSRKRSCNMGIGCQRGRPGFQEEDDEVEDEEVEDDDDDDDSGDTWDLGRCVGHCSQWPVPYMADTSMLVEELVEELLSACQRLSGNNFEPRLLPAIGLGCVYEGWSNQEDNILYQLLVPLQPPPGHTFSLELGTTKDMLTSASCLHVHLQCMCMWELLVQDVLCFLHHSADELKRQRPSLLSTLCTNSYLDIEKTACWFQTLVKDAWKLVPQSLRWQLTVLPATRSCRLQLQNGEDSLSIEMIFGVQLDDSDCFLSLE